MNNRPEGDGDRDGDGGSLHVPGVGALQGRRRLLRGTVGAVPVLLSISSGPAIAGNQVMTASAKCSASTSALARAEYECNGKTHRTWCNDAHDPTKDDGEADWDGQERCYVSHGMKKSSDHGWPSTAVPKTKHYGGSRPQVWKQSSEAWSTSANHYEVMNRHCAKEGRPVDKYWDKVENPGNQSSQDNKQRSSDNKQWHRQPKPSTDARVLKLAAHCSAAFLNCEARLVPPEVCDPDKVREIWNACKSGGHWIPAGSNCQEPWNTDDVCDWFNSMCTS